MQSDSTVLTGQSRVEFCSLYAYICVSSLLVHDDSHHIPVYIVHSRLMYLWPTGTEYSSDGRYSTLSRPNEAVAEDTMLMTENT